VAGDIIIKGGRQHNLKNIDLTLPRNQLVITTGLSGSGKSSLAFDTIYAEGQRRYVASLSLYARQFLDRLDKPDVDFIDGLSPAIAIEQKSADHNPRSTVGTVTEIYDYLRLLFARTGSPHCPQCNLPIQIASIDTMVDEITALGADRRIIIMAPIQPEIDEKMADCLTRLMRQGFARARINGVYLEINDAVKTLTKKEPSEVEVVIDRLITKPSLANRLADSLELAAAQGDGAVMVVVDGDNTLTFSDRPVCAHCQIPLPEITPALFSFNAPQGACKHCSGLGTVDQFDPDRIVPNRSLSLREGAVKVWAGRNSLYFVDFLDAFTHLYQTDIFTPFNQLPPDFVKAVFWGSGKVTIPIKGTIDGPREEPSAYEGVIPLLERQWSRAASARTQKRLRRYLSPQPCPLCEGHRLNPMARSIFINGRGIHQVARMPIRQMRRFFKHVKLEKQQQAVARPILTAIDQRLGFLENVGLDYLDLARPARTLSGGESQRIRMATQIGSKLSGVLYVLDEPSIGLHPKDTVKLIQTLKKMRDLGNTILVVEHDLDMIRAADWVVDMGPGGGIHGGNILYNGPPKAIHQHPQSLTGQYLYGKRSIGIPKRRRKGNGRHITINGATQNNLKAIDVSFPLGCLIGVTGVSGSGKSSLVIETLYPHLKQRLYQSLAAAGKCGNIEGTSRIDRVINIDQTAIGRTPRSNPATYTGVFTTIRDLFAKTPDARAKGYRPGRFSFNAKGGRCEACRGDGIIKVEMHFLPDVFVACGLCKGKRYNRETLGVCYKGVSIAEVLDMTIAQALSFFKAVPAIAAKLQTLCDVGLEYVKLGQPSTTLSGGEAQRMRLSRELGKNSTGNTLYILDEPTTGLHMEDIVKLLTVLNRLVKSGNSVIIIEHHLDVIKSADYLIDLGPEGGSGGGEVVGCGTPEQLALHKKSHTGHFLNKVLNAF